MYSRRKRIAWCLCTPPLPIETFSELINKSGKEIAGLMKKKKIKEYVDMKSRNLVYADSRVPNRRHV